jgi:hypothetical protein
MAIESKLTIKQPTAWTAIIMGKAATQVFLKFLLVAARISTKTTRLWMIIEHTTAEECSKFPHESYHGYTMEDKPEKGTETEKFPWDTKRAMTWASPLTNQLIISLHFGS